MKSICEQISRCGHDTGALDGCRPAASGIHGRIFDLEDYAMTHRETKRRTLEKQGFAHVAGWLPKTKAAEVQAMIEAAKADVEKAEQK